MKQSTQLFPRQTLGLDVGDRWIHVARVDAAGEAQQERIRCSKPACHAYFEALERCRVALEVGTHSRWLGSLLERAGHEVFIANAGRVRSISTSNHKSDQRDALELARLGRLDPRILHPIQHRPEAMQQDLLVLHVRDALVRSRTLLINQARGMLKAAGHAPRRCSAEAFTRRIAELAPPGSSVAWLLPQIQSLSADIKRLEKKIEELAQQRYPAAALVRQIKGVGPITSLAFVLVIFEPKRFRRSRDVAPYLGLVPKKHQSGDKDPQLGITKAGNAFLRRLLVQSAHYILGAHGPDCELRRYGKRLAGHGGKGAGQRAVVAVARKLAVLMHHLWVSGEVYRPLAQAALSAD